jgi:hypothetical protein
MSRCIQMSQQQWTHDDEVRKSDVQRIDLGGQKRVPTFV